MSDFNSSLPVRTQTNGDVAAILVDKTVTTQGASVDAQGSLHVGLYDTTGTSQGTATNPLYTTSVDVPGIDIVDYNTAAAVGAGATSNHDHAVGASKSFKVHGVFASSSGKLRIECQTSPDGATFTSIAVGFSSTANPNIYIPFPNPVSVSGTGSKFRVIRKNTETVSVEDVYSTIIGIEN